MSSYHEMNGMSDKIISDLKREGKYDEIRRNIADELATEGVTSDLQIQVKAKIEKMLETLPPSTKKDELRSKVREELSKGPRVDTIARSTTHDMSLYEQLRAEISTRVRMKLGLITKEEGPAIGGSGDTPSGTRPT
ncbi:hypothetical protein PENTCL1PPCAC_26139, partial [Pristionchus entomophagus]